MRRLRALWRHCSARCEDDAGDKIGGFVRGHGAAGGSLRPVVSHFGSIVCPPFDLVRLSDASSSVCFVFDGEPW